MDGTFFWVAIAAGSLFSISNIAITHIIRKEDILSVILFRNLSLMIIMFPLLMLAGKDGIIETLEQWPYILASGISGAFGAVGSIGCKKYLPVGIAGALGQMSPIFITFWSYLFLEEVLTLFQWIFVVISIAGAIFLSCQKSDFEHLSHHTKGLQKGFALILMAWIFGSLSIFYMSFVASNGNPFAAGYFWESSIAISLLILLSLAHLIKIQKFTILPARTILNISYSALPILGASGLYPLALSLGPNGLVSITNTVSALLCAIILGIIFFKEHLSKKQYIGIFIIIIGVIGIRLSI